MSPVLLNEPEYTHFNELAKITVARMSFLEKKQEVAPTFSSFRLEVR